jgi:hypothetical protein
MSTSKKRKDPLGDVLGAPFKWLGGDLPAGLIMRGINASQSNNFVDGLNTFLNPKMSPEQKAQTRAVSDMLVRPGVNAGKDFLHTWVSPLGGFYDNAADGGRGGYNFNESDPAMMGLSALSAVPIAGKVAKGVRIAAGKPKLNRVSKNAIRESMGKAPRVPLRDQLKSGFNEGYNSIPIPGGAR